eukprot:2613560-Prymnesium_polylepis.1
MRGREARKRERGRWRLDFTDLCARSLPVERVLVSCVSPCTCRRATIDGTPLPRTDSRARHDSPWPAVARAAALSRTPLERPPLTRCGRCPPNVRSAEYTITHVSLSRRRASRHFGQYQLCPSVAECRRAARSGDAHRPPVSGAAREDNTNRDANRRLLSRSVRGTAVRRRRPTVACVQVPSRRPLCAPQFDQARPLAPSPTSSPTIPRHSLAA